MANVDRNVRYPEPNSRAEGAEDILSGEAVKFLSELHNKFEVDRRMLLERRNGVAETLSSGRMPAFSLNATRSNDWQVAPTPADLRCRHVEITGPCESKMMINALNSGADVFMADIEDSLSPTWENVISAQRNLKFAVNRVLSFISPEGKQYRLRDGGTTLMVRPRGWHLVERNFLINGQAISASLFDFGLHFFHCAKTQIALGSGPYFYLPKLECALEARLWNDVFLFAQERLGIPRGTIRATVLIETITAAFEMDDILYELREHAAGLNAGRWDYLFSILKKFPNISPPFPDRSRLTMDLPFMNAYCRLLVDTCHRRGAHAIGGMSAFIPSRKDAVVNALALEEVRADKEREIEIGFDGSWVAHPDLVPIVKSIFSERLNGRDDQKNAISELRVDAQDLLPQGLSRIITEGGIRKNIAVSLTYLNSWLNGSGAVAIDNLMEDAATAEISRAQLWQWVHSNADVKEGFCLDESIFRDFLAEEMEKLKARDKISKMREAQLIHLLEYLVLNKKFPNFLTESAYELLLTQNAMPETQSKEDRHAKPRYGSRLGNV